MCLSDYLNGPCTSEQLHLSLKILIFFFLLAEHQSSGFCGKFLAYQYNLNEVSGVCFGLLVKGAAEGPLLGA